MSETLFDKARQNYNVANMIRKEMGEDEAYLNYIGYHLQQAVELTLKYGLEINGVEYSKTHDITQLLLACKSNDINIGVTEYIDDHSEMFTLWESKTRYITNYRLEKEKIDKAIGKVEKFLNAAQEELLFEEEINLSGGR